MMFFVIFILSCFINYLNMLLFGLTSDLSILFVVNVNVSDVQIFFSIRELFSHAQKATPSVFLPLISELFVIKLFYII